jgi:hypothetical protein
MAGWTGAFPRDLLVVLIRPFPAVGTRHGIRKRSGWERYVGKYYQFSIPVIIGRLVCSAFLGCRCAPRRSGGWRA